MIPRKARKNIYPHQIELVGLNIRNTDREKFRKQIELIKYRGYEVEQISDGRKIVITKPGGKFTFGTVKKDDFMVWIYQPEDKTLWLISHKNILDDLEEKGLEDPANTIKIIDALERVYNGEEPDVVLQQAQLTTHKGEIAELLLKAYKWIWGQEDVNYPDGKGRAMSWEGWSKNEKREWERTGNGLIDLKSKLTATLP